MIFTRTTRTTRTTRYNIDSIGFQRVPNARESTRTSRNKRVKLHPMSDLSVSVEQTRNILRSVFTELSELSDLSGQESRRDVEYGRIPENVGSQVALRANPREGIPARGRASADELRTGLGQVHSGAGSALGGVESRSAQPTVSGARRHRANRPDHRGHGHAWSLLSARRFSFSSATLRDAN